MNGKDTSTTREERGNPNTSHPRRHRTLGAVTLLLVGGLTGAGLVTAYGVAAHAGRGGFGMYGDSGMYGGPGMHMDGQRGPLGEGRHGRGHGEGMKDRVAWMLGAVDASPEQSEKVQTLLGDMFDQMREMRGERQGLRRTLVTELAGAEVDRAELERIRAEHMTAMQTRSQAMVDGLATIAETLTPEQRARIAEMMAAGRGMHR